MNELELEKKSLYSLKEKRYSYFLRYEYIEYREKLLGIFK